MASAVAGPAAAGAPCCRPGSSMFEADCGGGTHNQRREPPPPQQHDKATNAHGSCCCAYYAHRPLLLAPWHCPAAAPPRRSPTAAIIPPPPPPLRPLRSLSRHQDHRLICYYVALPPPPLITGPLLLSGNIIGPLLPTKGNSHRPARADADGKPNAISHQALVVRYLISELPRVHHRGLKVVVPADTSGKHSQRSVSQPWRPLLANRQRWHGQAAQGSRPRTRRRRY